MFLTELRVEVDKESESYFTLVSPNCGEVAVAAPTTHERNNWLKKVAMAQKHINDTQNSHRHRQLSSKALSRFVFILVPLLFRFICVVFMV